MLYVLNMYSSFSDIKSSAKKFKCYRYTIQLFYIFVSFIIEGRMHDARILGESGLMQQLNQYAFATDGTPLCLYGDLAYPLRVHLQQPFRNNDALTDDMRQYNKAMSAVRVSVEWLFGEITKYFKFVDLKQQIKIRLSPIGKIYIVCALLQNCLACLYGNIVSEYFEVNPPTLENYFWRADA